MQISNTRIDMKLTGKKLSYLAKLHGYCVKDIQEYLGLACPQPVYRWYKGIILPSVDNLLRLDYGRNFEPGMIKEADGTNIDLSSAEALYSFLKTYCENKRGE